MRLLGGIGRTLLAIITGLLVMLSVFAWSLDSQLQNPEAVGEKMVTYLDDPPVVTDFAGQVYETVEETVASKVGLDPADGPIPEQIQQALPGIVGDAAVGFIDNVNTDLRKSMGEPGYDVPWAEWHTYVATNLFAVANGEDMPITKVYDVNGDLAEELPFLGMGPDPDNPGEEVPVMNLDMNVAVFPMLEYALGPIAGGALVPPTAETQLKQKSLGGVDLEVVMNAFGGIAGQKTVFTVLAIIALVLTLWAFGFRPRGIGWVLLSIGIWCIIVGGGLNAVQATGTGSHTGALVASVLGPVPMSVLAPGIIALIAGLVLIIWNPGAARAPKDEMVTASAAAGSGTYAAGQGIDDKD